LDPVLGNVDEIGSERYFVTITCFVASLFLFVLCLVHLFMNLKLAPVLIAGGGSIMLMVLYFITRFSGCLLIPKLILSLVGLVLLDLTWYSKFLSNGPVLFFVMIFGALVLWVWEGRSLFLLLLVYYINIGILFLIDLNAPPEAFLYPEGRVRSVDIFLSFTLYSALLILLLYTVKRDFTQKKERAIRSDKLKSAFLANMSHEIRTPMNAIVGFSNLLKETKDPELKAKYIDTIQSSSENLIHLIDDILDLSIIESGALTLDYSHFNVKEIFEELLSTYKVELSSKGKSHVNLSYEIQGTDHIAYSDPIRLKQILSNLLSNAVKFTSEGEIKYSCEKLGEELLFSVSDTGIGIPDEDQEQVFDRFTTFDYNGLNKGGTGIGLSIAERVVAILKGKIWVESKSGRGSVFHVTIPHQNDESYLKSKTKTFPIKDRRKEATKQFILLVEDDPSSQELMLQMLKPLDLNLSCVSSGRAAVEFVDNNPHIKLILMDLKLPELDGYEASRAIKAKHPELPIVAQTAFAMAGDREKAKASGCDDYITKPIKTEELYGIIFKYLSKS
jgi:signal transduction histidine kinase/CheY-like chemotaxis protein